METQVYLFVLNNEEVRLVKETIIIAAITTMYIVPNTPPESVPPPTDGNK